MMLKRIVPLAAVLLLSAASCLASGHGEHRQHTSHVHGIGHLNVAMEGTIVYIELASPAANIVGFEHQPSSDAERRTVLKATETLEDGDSLFVFSTQAKCTLASAKISSPLLASDHEDGHHHSDAHEEKHSDGEHDGTKDHEAHSEGTHSEFSAEYQFSCAHPEKLKSLETQLFSAFPELEKLQTQILTTTGQTGAALTAKNHRLEL